MIGNMLSGHTSANPSRNRSQWVRLRTLVVLRWIAIVGQVGTILVADQLLQLNFPVEYCYMIVGVSILANALASILFPENQRLSETQVTAILLFDLAQLVLLIFLTGGLNNPFAILVLAPVAIGAAALQLWAIIALALVTMVFVTLVGLYHFPLMTAQGFVLQLPTIFLMGFWVAIMTGVIFVATIIRRVSDETHTMGDALMATQLALSREQKLTDIGGVVAAAAHELGTPLATIKLTSSELADQLDPESEFYEDARLIGEQTDRCRDILRSMGRAGKDDLHMRTAPVTALIEEAAEPHVNRGKEILFDLTNGDSEVTQPIVRRNAEIMHGLRNLVQNAVDFADETVWVESKWDDETIVVRISDDGPGYPPHLIGRIGDPFMRRRNRSDPQRPQYEGMGLGLFISKTLLERSGAELAFANGSDPFLADQEKPLRKGAIVEVTWQRSRLEANAKDLEASFGENMPMVP